MMSRYTYWRGIPGIPGRIVALAVLTLALGVAVGTAPTAHAASATDAAPTSCGTAKSGCGPMVCAPITPQDYTLPTTSPRGGVRASLNRTSGVSGSTDTLTGSGWPAFATVEIFLGTHQSGGGIWVNPTPFAQGVAGASGRLSIAAFQTPQAEECTTKDGSHFDANQTLFVAQTPDGKARVSLVYTIYPAPVFASQASPVIASGAPIMMTGSGWEPEQTVTITPAVQPWPSDGYPSYSSSAFQPLPGAAMTVIAQRDGTFSVTAQTPAEPPETQITFFASANSPRDGDISIMLNNFFSVIPAAPSTLTLSRSAALAGGSVTLTGTNWPVNQTIQISYCRGAEQTICDPSVSALLAQAPTDSVGHLHVTIQIPADARPGPITIQAAPVSSPFDSTVYTHVFPFAVQYPFAQAHPRLEMALHALPYAIAALVVALIALGVWLVERRRRGPTLAARQ